MQKLLWSVGIAVLLTGMWILSVAAQSGQVDDRVQLGTAVCVNNTQNVTSTATVQNNAFDCGNLLVNEGDQIGILLMATGGSTPPTPSTCTPANTTVITEQEPNNVFADNTVQNVTIPPAGACIAINGTIETGAGPDGSNPAADIDGYRLTLLRPMTFVLSLAQTGNTFVLVVGDPTTGQIVSDCSQTLDACQVQANSSAVDFITTAVNAGNYTLTIANGSSGVGVSFAPAAARLLATPGYVEQPADLMRFLPKQ